MPLKPCLSCGLLSDQARCPTHRAERERDRPARPTGATRDHAERQRRAAAVAQHRSTYGEWCPGFDARPAHVVVAPNVLTADHVIAVGRGGAQSGRLVVRCRECNGAKSDKSEKILTGG